MDMYTSLVIVTAALLCVMSTDIITSRMLDTKMKRNAILVCGLLFASALCEWLGVKTDCADVSLIPLHKAAKLTEFCVAPAVSVLAAFTYGKPKKPMISVAVLTTHAIFEVVALHFGWVISVNAANEYRRGSLYFIYILVFSASILYCYAAIIREEFRRCGKIDAVIFATLVFLMIGITIQMRWSGIRIDFLCTAIGNYFLYNHYCKTIFQMDGLTHLLNRRCFQKDLFKLNRPAVFITMDVNDFKKINDDCGHVAGDACLKAVALAVRSAYGKHGLCYRVGGDEFCVILRRRTEQLSALNANFEKRLGELKNKNAAFKGVAVGCAEFNGSEDPKDALARADEAMYRAKNEQKAAN